MTCPLCHTADDAVTNDTLNAGVEWRCKSCTQTWSVKRLEAVAAYAAFTAVRDAPSVKREPAS
jgi:transposase-like protein